MMAGVHSSPPSPGQTRTKTNMIVNEQPKFDLESYIANYKGRTRLERLVLIGICSSAIGIEALKAGVHEAKNGQDVNIYDELLRHLQTVGPTEPEAHPDYSWRDKTIGRNKAETTRLEAELKGYKNNLIKESIRMGNEDLGKHFLATGDLNKAFEAFSRMRQDVSMAKQIIDISRNLINIAVEQRNWIAVSSNVQKIKGLLQTSSDDPTLQPFMCAAEGLAHLDCGEFRAAALQFLQTDAGMGSGCNTIISPNDVAVYGGLCALATMEREELNKKVLENSNFRTYLELEPHIRRAITFFVNSRYYDCLNVLESYRTDYWLDIYLQRHIDDLFHQVRSKSIVQYFIPFSCVTLDSLNQAFAAPGKTVDKELSMMIKSKELEARIDTQNRLLIAVPSTPRATLQSTALETAKNYEHEARRRIQHMNIIGADLDIRQAKRAGLNNILDDFHTGGESLIGSGGRDLRSGRLNFP